MRHAFHLRPRAHGLQQGALCLDFLAAGGAVFRMMLQTGALAVRDAAVDEPGNQIPCMSMIHDELRVEPPASEGRAIRSFSLAWNIRALTVPTAQPVMVAISSQEWPMK